MLDLGALKAKIALDSKDAVTKMKDFRGETNNTDSKLKSFTSNLGTAAKSAMVGFAGAATAAGAAMVGVTTKALETTANIQKFSATTNTTAEEFQKLDGVMQTMGWSMESAAGDFVALSEKMHEAATTGEGEAYEMFEKLGVSTTNLDGSLRNTGDVFNDMVLSLQNVEDATERQAMASIMLGTTSEEIAPLLAMTNEEFIAMKDNVNVIDDEQLKQAEAFKQSWDSLKQTFSTVVTEIGIALMPVFQTLADWINEHMPQIQAVVEMVFSIVTEVIGTVVNAIGGLIEWFKDLLSNNEEIGAGIKEVWDTASKMFSTFFKGVQELLSAFSSFCIKVWDKYGESIMSIIKPLWEQVKNIFQTGFDIVKGIIDFFTAMFTGDFEGMSEAITGIVDTMWEWVKESFSNLITFITNLVPTMLQAGKDLFNGLWDGLKSIWTGIYDWFSEKIDWITDKLFFWRDAQDEMQSNAEGERIDGSHAAGINYVPFDGYTAQLHKGERVLTAEQARGYNQTSTSKMESLLEQLNSKLDRLPRNLAIENRF